MKAHGQLGLALYPPDLDTDAFRAAWADWLADRAERRLPRYTARAQDMQLRRLAEMGEARALEAIRWSIAQGYKGIFEPPASAAPAAAPKAPTTWELETKLRATEERIKKLKSRSPGDHCDLRDFLSAEEWEEYCALFTKRNELRKALLA